MGPKVLCQRMREAIRILDDLPWLECVPHPPIGVGEGAVWEASLDLGLLACGS